MIEKINNILSGIKDSTFSFERNKSFEGVKADFFAFRKGKNFIFPQRDYFFFYQTDSFGTSVSKVELLHNSARKYVNSLYKMQKALRFTVPNIASIFMSSSGFSEELIDLSEKSTRSVIGGEIHQIFLIDFNSMKFYSQGLNTVKVRGEVYGSFTFSKIDPQNRAYYLVQYILNKFQ